MKAKILAALKTEFKGLGFDEKTFEGIAETLAAMNFVTDENLATVVTGAKPALTSLQGEIDRRVNGLNKELNDLKNLTPKPPTSVATDPNDPIAKLTELITGLATTVKTLSDKDQAKEVGVKWEKALADKKIPKSFAKRYAPKSEAEYETALSDLESDYKEYLTESGAGSDDVLDALERPPVATGETKKKEDKVADAIEKRLQTKNKANESNNK